MPSPSGGSDHPPVGSGRGDESDKATKEKGDKSERSERTEKTSEKSDRTEKEQKDRSQKTEKDKDKDREKTDKAEKSDRGEKRTREAEKSDKTEKSTKEAKSSTPTSATATPNRTSTTSSKAPSSTTASKPTASKGGLSDEVLNQVAQTKFEAQEEKLRDVAKHTMVLLRDYSKLSAVDCGRKVGEIRKFLMKYEMQYVRVTELQEKRRRCEIEHLDAEAARCREEAETEADKIVELHEALGKERLRRKRYEGYEQVAAEVNKKKTRIDSQAEIDSVTAEIARIRQQRADLEDLIEQRTRRAQLLRGAAAELAADLRIERATVGDAIPQGSGDGDEAAPAAVADPVDVIS